MIQGSYGSWNPGKVLDFYFNFVAGGIIKLLSNKEGRLGPIKLA
jgi:hypothetical protein